MKRYMCPECGEKAVEEMMACGATNYFCTHCKKLISSKRINKEEEKEEEKK